MSVRTMARVWADSKQSGTHLLMLLAIADFADDEGNAYPAVGTLAEKCRMKPRNAQTILAALRQAGELEVRENEGPRGTNLYRIVMPQGMQGFAGVGVQKLAGVQGIAGVQRIARRGAKACAKPLQRIAPEPSLNHQEPVESAHAQRAPAADRGSRLPDNWQPTDADIAFCQANRPDLNPAEVAERFRDHWTAQPGAKGRKSNWPATWRNWVRNERKVHTAGGGNAAGGKAWEGAL